MTANSSQAATALLTEHLQYTPLSLIDDVINAVNNFVYQGISSLENGLFSTPPERLGFKPEPPTEEIKESQYSNAKQEIEEGLHKLETLLESTVDKNFDKFEIYVLRNVLSVPEELATWIKLNHYENITYPIPANTPTAEAVQNLRRKVAASRTVSLALASEHAKNEAILNQLREMASVVTQSQEGLSNLAFLGGAPSASIFHISSQNQQQPLRSNTDFTLSQLPALKAILAELRPKLAELCSTGLGPTGAREEIKAERKAYIEQRMQHHADRNGYAAENAGVMTGREIDEVEVQAMEKVANVFGPS